MLHTFLEDGRLELDNNAAERALRAVAVGRKKRQIRAGARRPPRAPEEPGLPVELPTLVDLESCARASAALAGAVSRGELPLGQAARLSRVIEATRAGFETVELERRIAALESSHVLDTGA